MLFIEHVTTCVWDVYDEDGNVTSRQADISTSEIKITINSRPLRVSGPAVGKCELLYAANVTRCQPQLESTLIEQLLSGT